MKWQIKVKFSCLVQCFINYFFSSNMNYLSVRSINQMKMIEDSDAPDIFFFFRQDARVGENPKNCPKWLVSHFSSSDLEGRGKQEVESPTRGGAMPSKSSPPLTQHLHWTSHNPVEMVTTTFFVSFHFQKIICKNSLKSGKNGSGQGGSKYHAALLGV